MAIDSSGRFSSRPARTHHRMMFLPTRTMTSVLYAPHRGTTSLIASAAAPRTVTFEAASLRDRLCSAVSGRSRRFYWAIAAVLPKTPR